MSKVVIRKYNGDDQYSWAVFRAEDVKGVKGVIMCNQAVPITAGCSKQEAQYYKRMIEKGEICLKT